jgi:molybdenum cofactor cytidylyltransferase
MGQAKQLIDWHGQPLVRHVASTALAAGLSPVVVVTGASGDRVRQAVEDLPVILAHNPLWETGQSASIRAGLRVLPPETGAAVFLLVDQPQVPATLLRSLVELHAETLAPIVAPLVGGQRANPVLFDRFTFSEFSAIQGDTGGRALFARYPVIWLEWHDESLVLDIDTVEDYHRLLALEGRSHL